MDNLHFSAKKIAFILLSLVLSLHTFADGGLNTYYKVGTYQGSVADAAQMVKTALTSADSPFEILGDYQPSKESKFEVIAFTRKDLVDICLQVPDKGILASVLRVGLLETAPGQIEVTLLNPEYLFYAYLRERTDDFANDLSGISIDVRMALLSLGQEFKPFGGSATDRELKAFRFTASMPSLDEPIIVHEFANFDDATRTIELNLRARRGGTAQVYKQLFADKQIALYGVALHDARMGEAFFLPQLGAENLANLPYELLVVGNKAIMLHGRYRLPLFWSNVPIRTHQKLYKTPRDIEEMMRVISQP